MARLTDLQLWVHEGRRRGHTVLTFELRSWIEGMAAERSEHGPVPLRLDPFEYFQELYQDHLEELTFKSRDDQDIAEKRLEALGIQLFQNLLPEDLQMRFWKLRADLRTLQIISDEPWIPWELLKLQGEENGLMISGPFFGEAFAITRWFRDSQQVIHLPLQRLALVASASADLPEVSVEREFILSLGSRSRAVRTIPSRFLAVTEALASGSYDGWHFTGHGFSHGKDPNQWAILLDKGEELRPADLCADARNLGAAKPLIFFNACHTGRSAFSLTGIGGWSKKFIEAGSGAFLGAQWKIPDDRAVMFAQEFYNRFIQGVPIGEATRQARETLRKKYRGDPSAFAHAAFAHPMATCRDTKEQIDTGEGFDDPVLLPTSFNEISQVHRGTISKMTSTLIARRIKVYYQQIIAHTGALSTFLITYFTLMEYFKLSTEHSLFGATALYLVTLFLLLDWLRRERRKRLVAGGLRGRLQDPGYFRLRPYEEGERYTRSDRAHLETLHWILNKRSSTLYLTGRSGTGKTSLLNAWVLPRLREHRVLPLVVRSFRDPVEALHEKIREPGIIWHRPPAAEPNVRRLLERACASLNGKDLLIMFDQFEEFVILHGESARRSFETLLESLAGNPIKGLRILLVLRSDYVGFLDQLRIPPLHQDLNWKEINPFSVSAARGFFKEAPGMGMSPILLHDILKEASDIEETPGLIRPITLNMLGVVAGRFSGSLSRGLEPGVIMRNYLQEVIDHPDIRDHSSRVLRAMITDTGTKKPMNDSELADATRLKPELIRGCLFRLGNEGLVRPIDKVGKTWEISHDFLARLFNQILSPWSYHYILRQARSWLLPIAIILGTIGLPIYRTWVYNSAITELISLGAEIVPLDKGYRIIGIADHNREPVATEGRSNEQILAEACKILKGFDFEHLELNIGPLEDISGLAMLENLTNLSLSGSGLADPLRNLEPIRRLLNLKNLKISTYPLVHDLTPLANLKELEYLNLEGLQGLANLNGLQELEILRTLRVSDLNSLRNIEALANLSNVQHLTLQFMKQLKDIEPISSSTGLSEIRLFELDSVDSLPSFEDIKGLRLLNLGRLQNIRHLGSIASTCCLKVLYLNDLSSVADISALAHAKNLEELAIFKLPRIKDLEPLRDIENIIDLDLADLPMVTDIDAISVHQGMVRLRLAQLSMINDLSPLARLSQLQELAIVDLPNIKSVEVLSALEDLRRLELSGLDRLGNLNGLQNLKHLERLSLGRLKEVEKLTPLRELTNLQHLGLASLDRIGDDNQELLYLLRDLVSLKSVTLSPVGNFSKNWRDAFEKYRPDLRGEIRYF